MDHESLTDEELANRVRNGDDSAFGVLWARHVAVGRAAARQFDSIADADDLVSDAYLAILRILRGGGGPRAAFRPYLYRTIRNIAYTRARSERPVSLEVVGDMAGDDDFESASTENGIASQAFQTLPDRWQAVLWYTEVEGMAPAEASRHLGMTANGVAALAYRAREGFRRAWLQAHVNATAASPGCRWTTDRMGDYVRDALTPRARARFDAHLADCSGCRLLLDEITGLGRNLAVVLLPTVLGTGAALSLLASRPEAGAAVAASSPAAVTSAPAGSGLLATVAPLAAAVVIAAGAVGIGMVAGTPASPDPVVAAEPALTPAPVDEPEIIETPPDEDAPAPAASSEPPATSSPATPPVAPPVTPPKPDPDDDPGEDEDGDGDGDGDRVGILMVPAPPTLCLESATAVYLPTLSGTGTPGLQVLLETADGEPLGATVVGRDGVWSVPLDDPNRGAVDIVARQSDPNGKRSDPSTPVSLRLERPVVLSPADGAAIASEDGAAEVEVEFGGIPGRRVQVILDGVPTGNIHVLGEEPLVRVTPPLRDGKHTLAFRYVDPESGAVGASVTVAFVISPQP